MQTNELAIRRRKEGWYAVIGGEFLPLGAANLKEASALCSGTTGKTRRGHSVFLWAVRNWTKFGSYLIDMIR